MELRLPLEVSPGREATCRAVFGTWGCFPDALQQQLRVLAVLTRAWPRLGLGLWLGWAGSGVLLVLTILLLCHYLGFLG